MTAAVAERLEGVDPGFVRSRRGVRAVCATVLAWATMVAVTAVFDVADPVRITLLAAGAAFEGALLAPDPQPRDRVRTLGCGRWSQPDRGVGRSGTACPADVFVVCAGPPPFSIHPTRGTK